MVSAKEAKKRFAAQNDEADAFDPADVDGLADDTAAGSRKRRAGSAGYTPIEEGKAGPGKKRLRMRAEIPELPEYKGKTVARKDTAFGNEGKKTTSGKKGSKAVELDKEEDSEEDDDDDEDDDAGDDKDGKDSAGSDLDNDDDEDVEEGHANRALSDAAGGGFRISDDLEDEYAKIMKQSKHELEVMRTPSTTEVVKREAEGRRLKKQIDAWSSLVEFRIHLEGALGLAHRLPVAAAHSSLCAPENGEIAAEAGSAADQVSGLLATLGALQQSLADSRGLQLPAAGGGAARGSTEAATWDVVDARQRPVLDWALGQADDWKERTQLDARRSFKVLDQSLGTQMQAFAETDPEKLRRRCTPPAGRHQVFGAKLSGAAANGEATADAPEDLDIFDDRDFYMQLLREVLSSGGGQSAEGGLQGELQELQGRRSQKKKARNEVERRASKGRKIRYVPIERLQNFMSSRPRSEESSSSAGGLFSAFAGGGGSGFGASGLEALMQSLFAGGKVS